MSVRTVTVSTTVAALLGGSGLLLAASQTQAAGTHDAPVVFAHRGASAYAPENTLAAVDAADDLGIDWVENDVQRTRDGVLVVMHDTNLKRTTDVEELFPERAPWAVKDFTAAEIARLDAGSWFERSSQEPAFRRWSSICTRSSATTRGCSWRSRARRPTPVSRRTPSRSCRTRAGSTATTSSTS